MTLEQRRKLLTTGQAPVSPVAAAAAEQAPDLMSALETGGYSALNSALLGLPDLAVKTINSDSYKRLQKMREANQSAANIGDIVGTVGSLFIPGGLVAKGLGAGGKGRRRSQSGRGIGKRR